MDGKIQSLMICGYRCTLYLPKSYDAAEDRFPVVYLNGGNHIDEMIAEIECRFCGDKEAFILLGIEPENWGDEYSPWPVPALKSGEKPFGGCAGAYLDRLVNRIKPFMDLHYHTRPEPESTTLMGYSLGGLVSLYALYRCAAFGKIGCLSGSLWYDGWVPFMQSNPTVLPGAKVYLSLGKGEPRSRNDRMAKVGDCTTRAAEILMEQLISPKNLKLEWNPGGHFTEIPQRFVKAMLWLLLEDRP